MLWIILALLLLCSGLVSASETALFGLGRQALHGMGRSKGRLHRRVFALMQRPRQVLLSVLMANTAINVALFSISFLALRRFGSTEVTAVGGAATLLAVIVFGEMLPKAVALTNAQRLAPSAAAMVGMLQTMLAPILWLLATFLVEPVTRLLAPHRGAPDSVTTEELKLLVEHSAREGVINSIENDMLQGVVGLTEVGVREVMTPRVDIRSVSMDSTRTEILDAVRTWGVKRVLVCGRDLDDIRGILQVRDLLLNPDTPITSLVRRPHFVPEQVNLMQLLRHFQTERIHLAVLVDEYGGTAGLVTSEDVIEWIVGDLPDDEAPRPAVVAERIDEDTYRLPGDLSVHLWADRFAVGEIDRHVDTLGGLILAKLGRLPRCGDCVHVGNLALTVEKMNRRRIEAVQLRRHGNGPTAAEAAR